MAAIVSTRVATEAHAARCACWACAPLVRSRAALWPADVPAGAVIGGEFRVIAPLGRGGMGTVYVAEEVVSRRPCALKLIVPARVADARDHKRFEHDAQACARIASAHIADVVAAGVDRRTGIPYLATELLEGEDLAAHLERRGPLSPAEAGAIALQVSHALGAAHASGVVHRDLKPSNVFLAHAGIEDAPHVVKVLDFGVARVVSDGAATHAVGSPLWMAPEQTMAGQPIVAAADVWSFGLLVYRMLVGQSYWRIAGEAQPPPLAVMREILYESLDAASVRAARSGVHLPDGFDAWFARCVARDPSARFATATEAWGELRPVLEPEPVSEAPSHGRDRIVSSIEITARGAASRRGRYISLALIAMVSLGAAAIGIFGRGF
jgi:serine/threonine protein kinase